MDVRANRRHRNTPREDRAVGALLGAAAAGLLVGAPPGAIDGLLPADGGGDTAGAVRLGRLVRAVLHRIDPDDARKQDRDLGRAEFEAEDKAENKDGDEGGGTDQEADTGRDAGHAGHTGPAIAPTVFTASERPWARALYAAVRAGDGPEPGPEAEDGPKPAQIALRAVTETPVPDDDPAAGSFPCTQWAAAVLRAHALGGDGAALYAGALAGARWGASGIPLDAHRRLAPTAANPRSLATSALVALRGNDPSTWPEQETNDPGADPHLTVPFQTAHPHDPGVILCNMPFARGCADTDADAVVSLCRQGPADHPRHLDAADRVDVWLFDRPGANPNLPYVLDQAARMVATLRAEGKRVLLHCAAGQSRTPAVAARYAVLARDTDVRTALTDVVRTVGGHFNNPELARVTASLSGTPLPDPATSLFPNGMPPTRHPLAG